MEKIYGRNPGLRVGSLPEAKDHFPSTRCVQRLGAWKCLNELSIGHGQFAPQASSSNEDPLVSVPLYVDRLRAAVAVLGDLLQYVVSTLRCNSVNKFFERASNPRPVPFPVGSVVRFCQALLSCTRDEKVCMCVSSTESYTHTSISWKVTSTPWLIRWSYLFFQKYGPMAAPCFRSLLDG